MTLYLPYLFFFLAASLPMQARVLVISVDGLRPDAITAWGAEMVPNFYRLRQEGIFTDNARTDVDSTVTLPNHISMVTSRSVLGPRGHGFTSNSADSNTDIHMDEYRASMFDVAHDNGLSTALFATKLKFEVFAGNYGPDRGAQDLIGEDNGKNKIDVYAFERSDGLLIEKFAEDYPIEKWDLGMIHFRTLDSVGHAWGWSLSKESFYMKSVKAIDGYLGELFSILDSDPDFSGTTHLIVTSDHGGPADEKRHSDPNLVENYRIPFYVWGPDVKAGGDLYVVNPGLTDPGTEQPMFDSLHPPLRNSAVGNLALDLLGMPPIPGSSVNVSQQLNINDPLDFAGLHPGLDPDDDANGNGLSNFFDYAVGADPLSAISSNLTPTFDGEHLIVCFRSNTKDIRPAYEISTDLTNWFPLVEDATIAPVRAEEFSAGRRLHLRVPTLGSRVYYRQIFEK